MAYPVLYDITYSYSGFQQAQGDNSFPGTQLDADLAGLQDSVEDLAEFVEGVMRSDGALNNGVVTFDSLSPSLQTAGLTPATSWATATFYAAGKSVISGSNLYRALLPHTSGVFATDLAAGKWLFVTSLPTGYTSVRDFGAKGDGVTDDAPFFQATIDSVPSGASISVMVPASAVSYKLLSAVVNNGRFVSWVISSGAQFSGAGSLPVFGSPNYGGWPITSARQAFVRGSPAAPSSVAGAITLAELHSNSTELGTQNPSIAAFATKYTNAPNTRVQAAFFEAADVAGWTGAGLNNFVEGVRAHGMLNGSTLGSAYGAVLAAIEPVGTTHAYLIGVEAEVLNNSIDAPVTLNANGFVASFNASSTGAKKADAAYLVNPFTSAAAAFVRGFYVPQGQANSPVVESAFRTDAPSSYGLYISGPTFASIRIPNSSPIVGSNAAGTSDLNLMFVAPSDQLQLGVGVPSGVAMHIRDTSFATPLTREILLGAANSGGAGFRQLLAPN